MSNTTDTKDTLYIILSAFALVGTVTMFAIWLPDNAVKVEFAVGATIGGIIGFIAGRSKK